MATVRLTDPQRALLQQLARGKTLTAMLDRAGKLLRANVGPLRPQMAVVNAVLANGYLQETKRRTNMFGTEVEFAISDAGRKALEGGKV